MKGKFEGFRLLVMRTKRQRISRLISGITGSHSFIQQVSFEPLLMPNAINTAVNRRVTAPGVRGCYDSPGARLRPDRTSSCGTGEEGTQWERDCGGPPSRLGHK